MRTIRKSFSRNLVGANYISERFETSVEVSVPDDCTDEQFTEISKELNIEVMKLVHADIREVIRLREEKRAQQAQEEK